MFQANAGPEYVYSSLATDPELGEIVGMFVEEMPERVASLLARFDRRDWDGLRQSAHQLKGAAGSYGFAAVSPCAGKLESAIRNGEPEQRIREAITELVELCGRVRSGQPTADAHASEK
jgi:histidine phosphotransfer protein HptB